MSWFKALVTTLMAFIALFVSATSQAAGINWSDRVCDKPTLTFQGATRDYYNRGALAKWANKMGDWSDAKGIPQGQDSFSEFELGMFGDELKADVTSLVKKWQLNVLAPNGILLKQNGGKKIKFFSREYQESQFHPRLIIESNRQRLILTAEKDTALNKSTYKCLGDEETIDLGGTAILDFDIDRLPSKIDRATLVLTSVKPIKQVADISVFAVRLPPPVTTKSNKSNRQLVYQADFNSSDWQNQWQISNGNAEIIKQDANFVAKSGKALKVTIAQGENMGFSAKLPLAQFEEFKGGKNNSALLSYQLYLGQNWSPVDDGKLPGLAGTYHKEIYRGGWGGRRSKGNNGWSARLHFSPEIFHPNPAADMTPVGAYLYHAEQKSNYGEAVHPNNSSDHVIKRETWYQVEQLVEMNTPGKNDGQLIIWLDGIKIIERTNVRFSNHPKVKIESVWLNVFHGGKTPSKQTMDLYIDNLKLFSVLH